MTVFKNALFPYESPSFGQQPPRWIYVERRFRGLLEALMLTAQQVQDGEVSHRSVVSCLNRAYWGHSDSTRNGLVVGSWAKNTRVRPPRDIDLLFVLRSDMFWRFETRVGNKQSQLLQDVAGNLRTTFPRTGIRGDGQVVVVQFDSYQVEVAPAFVTQGGGYLTCDTNAGGCWRQVDPQAELAALAASDDVYKGNTRKLVRILKQWQRYCDVPIASFQIEAMVKEMLTTRDYGGSPEFWYDWLVRDALNHMIGRANGTFMMPGTYRIVSLGDTWLSKAQTALGRALRACELEQANNNAGAGEEWQKLFGTAIARAV